MLPVSLGKKTLLSTKMRHGHTVVGTSAVPLTTTNHKFDSSIIVRTPGSADPVANTAPVWCGRSYVTADSDPDTGGFPLLPGDILVLPLEDGSEIFVISTAASQDIAWMGA